MHEQLKLGERFRFMGRTSDPHGVIRSSDLVLMTSISEAMPMALLEAIAQGRPSPRAWAASRECCAVAGSWRRRTTFMYWPAAS